MVLQSKNQLKDFSELIIKVKSGDRKASTEFYEIIHSVCRKIIRQKAYGITYENLNVLAHEITAEIILKKLKYYNSEKELYPWLNRVVCNLIIDSFRENKTSLFYPKNRVEISDNIGSNTIEYFNENQEVFFEEKTRLINTAILSLSYTRRELVVLYYFEEKSIKNISKLTNKSVPAITIELFRIRGILRTFLQNSGFQNLGEK